MFVLCAASSAEVLKIVVNDSIHPITDEYIGRAIAEAERNKDQALLIEINTPGGLLESTRDIIEKILASPVPVIIYVTPSGSRAASAGFFILESADVAAMAPGTNTGAAHPVTLGGGKMDDTMKEKIENDSAALLRSVVAKRGRNVEIAETAVRQSKSFTDQEALSQKLIDYVAPSEDDLFKQLQGKQVKRFNGETVTLNLVGEPVRPFGMTLKQHILAYLMDPNVAFILLAVGASGSLRRVQPSRRGGPRNGRNRLHSCRRLRPELAPHSLRRRSSDFRVVHPVRARGQIRRPRSAGDRRNRHPHLGRTVARGRAHPRDASPSADSIGGQHPSGTHHRLFNEHRPESAGQQSCHRGARTNRRNRPDPERSVPAGKSLRPRRTLGRNRFRQCARRTTGGSAPGKRIAVVSRPNSIHPANHYKPDRWRTGVLGPSAMLTDRRHPRPCFSFVDLRVLCGLRLWVPSS